MFNPLSLNKQFVLDCRVYIFEQYFTLVKKIIDITTTIKKRIMPLINDLISGEIYIIGLAIN